MTARYLKGTESSMKLTLYAILHLQFAFLIVLLIILLGIVVIAIVVIIIIFVTLRYTNRQLVSGPFVNLHRLCETLRPIEPRLSEHPSEAT
jgi:uncharacterized protein YneF (UPF0154 family)